MPCMKLFEMQSKEYKDSVLPMTVRARVSMEAGSTMPWFKYVGLDGEALGLDHYGASAPAGILFKEYGFTVDAFVQAAERVLNQ